MKNTRIGNIELRQTHGIGDELYWEIVQWFPNDLYGKESEYIYDERTGHYSKENQHYTIHKSCFANPECCCTIAFVCDSDSDEPDIRSVGSRPYVLEGDDKKNYDKIIECIYENRSRY